MSRVHVHFTKEQEDARSVTYRVDSRDFRLDRIEEPIARITIDRSAKTYSFEPLGELAVSRVVLPQIFDLSESELTRVLREQYQGYGYGGWTSRIANVVGCLIARDDFPDETYGVT